MTATQDASPGQEGQDIWGKISALQDLPPRQEGEDT